MLKYFFDLHFFQSYHILSAQYAKGHCIQIGHMATLCPVSQASILSASTLYQFSIFYNHRLGLRTIIATQDLTVGRHIQRVRPVHSLQFELSS